MSHKIGTIIRRTIEQVTSHRPCQGRPKRSSSVYWVAQQQRANTLPDTIVITSTNINTDTAVHTTSTNAQDEINMNTNQVI